MKMTWKQGFYFFYKVYRGQIGISLSRAPIVRIVISWGLSSFTETPHATIDLPGGSGESPGYIYIYYKDCTVGIISLNPKTLYNRCIYLSAKPHIWLRQQESSVVSLSGNALARDRSAAALPNALHP